VDREDDRHSWVERQVFGVLVGSVPYVDSSQST